MLASLASPFAKNIGAYMDGTLTFHKQITETCKSAFYSIRNIYKIRKFLNLDTAKILVHAFVTSKLDHCNSLLYGPPKYEIQRLQHALNSATRLITLSHKFDHITPLPMSLYWLAIVDWTAHRIQASRVGAVRILSEDSDLPVGKSVNVSGSQ